jgi:hypothetical protein
MIRSIALAQANAPAAAAHEGADEHGAADKPVDSGKPGGS